MERSLRHALTLLIGGVLVAAIASAKPARVASKPPPACPRGMVEIEAEHCPVIEQTCVSWLPAEKGGPPRCAEFEATSTCTAGTVTKHFCIDTYEYPNEVGKKPLVMKSWQEAGDICAAHGKRLCLDSEWTLACEGREHAPYPYGVKRDASACNIDKPQIEVDEKKLGDPATRGAELAKLWQGEPSGARAACVSTFGVFDMTGNVDEWVVNENGKPWRSGLKGGYWGRVRDACRPMTTAHGETFPFYQTGFRCCADPAKPKPPK